MGERRLSLNDGSLFLLSFFAAEPPLLLALELMVEKVKGLLIRFRRADDREHALTRLVVGFLGDRNLGAGESTDLGDLGSIPTDYTTNHVRGDRDCLSPEISLLRLLGRDRGWGRVPIVAAMASISVGLTMVPITSAGCAVTLGLTIVDGRVEKDGPGTSLPIFQQACSNLFDGSSNRISSSLYLDDSFG